MWIGERCAPPTRSAAGALTSGNTPARWPACGHELRLHDPPALSALACAQPACSLSIVDLHLDNNVLYYERIVEISISFVVYIVVQSRCSGEHLPVSHD